MRKVYRWLHGRVLDVMASRPPDRVIGGLDNPYLMRWHVIPRNPVLNVYLHLFLRSDDDRALHDHPWCSWSLLLDGQILEQLPDRDGMELRRVIRRGRWVFRWPREAHRIEVMPWRHALTLFVTGPRVREWGFHCPQGWRPWHRFVDPQDPGVAGPGCN
jgi:hypothetical protein